MGYHSANRNNVHHNALCEMDHHGIQGDQVMVIQDREWDRLQCDEAFLRGVMVQRDNHVCHGDQRLHDEREHYDENVCHGGRVLHDGQEHYDENVCHGGQGPHDEQEHYDEQEHRGEEGPHDEEGLHDEQELHGGQTRDGLTHDIQVPHDAQAHCDEELNDAQVKRGVLIHGVQGVHVLQTHVQYVLGYGEVQHDVQALDDVQELARDVLQHRGVRAQPLCDPHLHGDYANQHELNLVKFVQTLKGGQVGQSDDLHDNHHKVHVPPHRHDDRDDNGYKFHGHVHVVGSHHEHQSLASECTIFQTCHIGALDVLPHEQMGVRNEQLDGQHVLSATHRHHDVVLSLLFQGIGLPWVLLRLHRRPRET